MFLLGDPNLNLHLPLLLGRGHPQGMSFNNNDGCPNVFCSSIPVRSFGSAPDHGPRSGSPSGHVHVVCWDLPGADGVLKSTGFRCLQGGPRKTSYFSGVK